MSKYRRRLMGLSALRQALKDDFVRVEYIENTSNAYINSGIFGTMNLDFYIEFEPTELEQSVQKGVGTIFGSRTEYNQNVYQLTTYNKNATNKGHFLCAKNYGWNDNRVPTANMFLGGKNIIKKEGLIFTRADGTTFNLTSQSFTTPKTIYIFAYSNKNDGAAEKCDFKLYKLQFSKNGTLVRDFVPMYRKSTKEYGLWDRVEQRFYTSPNGTAFNGGHQIIYDAEIEYLRGTDPQYIETHIIPNNSTGVYLKAYRDDGNDNFVIGCRNSGGNTRWAIGRISSSGWYYGWVRYAFSSIKNSLAEIYLNYKNDRLFKVTASDGTETLSLPSSLPFTPLYNIRLFGSAGVNADYSKWNGRIYAVQITQGTEIIMDLIPVRVGNVGYMYDKVTNKLFGNDGSGSFILGQDTIVYDKI